VAVAPLKRAMSSRQAWTLQAALAGTALVIRIAAMVVMRAAEHGVETAHEHHVIAASLVGGHGFSFNFFGPPGDLSATSQQAPLVPMLLAGAYVMFGIASTAAFRGMILLQIGAATLTVLLIAELTREATSRWKHGFVAGLGACCYPRLVVSPLRVQALVWNLLWLVLLVRGAQAMNGSELARGRQPMPRMPHAESPFRSTRC
jgi:hypothetical protein